MEERRPGVLFRQVERLPAGADSWQALIQSELQRDPERYEKLDGALTDAYARGDVNPAEENLLRAFAACPRERVRVVLCGQDPYPNPAHAMGLSFSVPAGEKLPPSLKNILAELSADTGPSACQAGDLTPWAEQGVLLLNTALTVEAGNPGSHRKLWGDFCLRVLAEFNRAADRPLAFILWGKPAEVIGREMERTSPPSAPRLYLYGVHPSPLSAYRGFFGSRPFSRVNGFLEENGEMPVQW